MKLNVFCAPTVDVEEIRGLGIDFHAREILARDDVDDARDSACAVGRGSAVLQDFDALDHCRRDGLVVAAIDGLHTVDQRDRPVHAHATQVDLNGAVAAVVRGRADRRAGHRRHALDKVADVGDAGRDDGVVADDADRARALEVRPRDARSRDDDFAQILLCADTGRDRAEQCARCDGQRQVNCPTQFTIVHLFLSCRCCVAGYV